MSDPMGIGATDAGSTAQRRFLDDLAGTLHPRVLELGTLRWEATPTHHQAWAPHADTYVMSDVAAGVDVDVVADAHRLTDAFPAEGFDVVIAVSVWEHLARPWICAEQLLEVTRPGGIGYVCTHQTFPIHGYPSDYTRWTTEGLAELFRAAGWEVAEASYCYPATIVPPPEVTRWNTAAEAYLNVDVALRRPV